MGQNLNPIHKLFFFLAFIALIYGCGNYSVEDVAETPSFMEGYSPLSKIWCEQGYIDADSVSESFYEKGSVFSKGYFVNGIPNGKQTFYYENGELKTEQNYCMGIMQGKFTNYYNNGAINRTGYYLNGAMSGRWYFYYPNGSVKEIVQYKDNLEHGPFVEYHENGELKATGFYLNGNYEHGLLYLYQENGELKKRMRCNNGICFTISE